MYQHEVQVVGHDDHGVAADVGVLGVQAVVPMPSHAAGIVQVHDALAHGPEAVHAALATNGDEIAPGLAIVIALQANAAATVFFGVVGHGVCRFSTCSCHQMC